MLGILRAPLRAARVSRVVTAEGREPECCAAREVRQLVRERRRVVE